MSLRKSNDINSDRFFNEAFNDQSLNDAQLDEAAFDLLFIKYFTPLCAYCQYKFGLDFDLAKDIVQNGFIKLWESRHSISSKKAYLYKIVTNTCLNVLSHKKVKQRHEKYIVQNTPISMFEDVDMKQLEADIDRAVAELPEQMRRIFELSRYKCLKYSEIALQLNISVKTVETQISRALIKLKQKLSHYLTFSFIVLVFNVLLHKEIFFVV
jgi:RNA polymerase sigma-70 factor (ECF subfamily)